MSGEPEQHHERPPAQERAEEMVERMASDVTRFARRVAGRTREEVEDIVAEAQRVRRGEQPPAG